MSCNNRRAEARNKYMNAYDPNKQYPSQILGCKKFYGRAMLQKLPINNFQWRNDEFNFYENFIQNYDEDCYKKSII